MLSLKTRSTYHTLLDAAVLREGGSDSPAIIYVSTEAEPIHVSRQLFRESALHYATVLKHLGIGQGDLVIIAHTQNLESIYAFWGAMMLGAIPSMFPTLTEKLDPEIYMRDMGELVARSAGKVILTTDAFAHMLSERVGCPVYGSQQLLTQETISDAKFKLEIGRAHV